MKKIMLSGFADFFSFKDLSFEKTGESGFKLDFSKENLKVDGYSNHSRGKGISSLILLFVLFLFSNFLTAQSVGVDFSQSSNNNPTQGDIVWIGSIIQSSNSAFYEGQSTLQRTLLEGIPTHSSGTYRLRFTHQASKASINAYDFVMGWGGVNPSFGNSPTSATEGAIESSNVIYPTGFVTINQSSNLGPKGSRAPFYATIPYCYANPIPATLAGSMGSSVIPISSGSNVNARIIEFDKIPFSIPPATDNGVKRRVTLQGTRGVNATNLITSATLVFLGYDSGADQYAQYELIWTGPTSGDPYDVQIKMAGHIAQSIAPGGTGYGIGKGASSISGGPYHFKLSEILLGPGVNGAWSSADTKSLGAQDNQLKGADILLPPPACDITGSYTICQGGTSGTYSGPAGMDSYLWSISPAGATLSATNTQNVTVTSNTPGSYTLTLVTTLSGKNSIGSCTASLTVNANPTVTVNSPTKCTSDAAVAITATPSPAGTYSYAWTVPVGV
ncbi:hypothetical protein, partial [Flavobacterium sp.]|uniref:hypothetical protein n=1 Tax=Flavobacterium sp. TaxID=239 RepID=UPI0038FC1DA7